MIVSKHIYYILLFVNERMGIKKMNVQHPAGAETRIKRRSRPRSRYSRIHDQCTSAAVKFAEGENSDYPFPFYYFKSSRSFSTQVLSI
jgi:hypothetical protein